MSWGSLINKMHTALKNTSLVVFPEKLKNREGYLLGINVSEFVLVILDVIDLRSGQVDLEETREYLELQQFRDLTEKLVQVEHNYLRESSKSWAI